eukprot:3500332-Rhodomonas_salina.1
MPSEVLPGYPGTSSSSTKYSSCNFNLSGFILMSMRALVRGVVVVKSSLREAMMAFLCQRSAHRDPACRSHIRSLEKHFRNQVARCQERELSKSLRPGKSTDFPLFCCGLLS